MSLIKQVNIPIQSWKVSEAKEILKEHIVSGVFMMQEGKVSSYVKSHKFTISLGREYMFNRI